MAENRELISADAYSRIRDPMEFIQKFGRSIALSRMIGDGSEAQGQVIAWECLSRRTSLLSLAERYHLIHGRLTLKAETMLSEFRSKLGGSYRLLERSPTRAAISLTLGGETQEFSLTWDEAEKEPFVYEGKENDVVAKLLKGQKPPLKAKYATPRSRMQMLWSRVISDAVNAMAPEIRSRGYTPEEVADFDEVQGDQEVQDAVYSVSEPEPEEQPAEAEGDAPFDDKSPIEWQSEDGYATAEQSKRIHDLYVALQVPYETQQAILEKRGIKAIRSMPVKEADELIGKLQQKMSALAAQDDRDIANSPSKTDTETRTEVNEKEPATQEQIDQVKTLMSQIAQTSDREIGDKVKGKLREAGLNKLADLTIAECDVLIESLGVQNVAGFLQAQVQGHRPS